MTSADHSTRERARLRRLIRQAWSERLWLTFLFLVAVYPFLWRLAVRMRLQGGAGKPASPFVYTLR
ncbi:hypothetical protein HUE56_00870 (plasmid) [Azospirillum oryzae]|uniref:Uncharacterized protein n=1 Tax=Azospirillum oryzae TaxID=286727 RepID=A0A6N1AIN7_9PROT|nr:hypothetical protein [Azospirillum oryzae]KAA0586648.1 hypothetical protein FZ938_20855 [Azospirillum oryzae]QKS49094.1 hypothetical protein HUE56_00870 [Azospirillum oryzae]GLR80790.1 hypothetical protein GCM10007856_34700 [Azospirillum oryzae]